MTSGYIKPSKALKVLAKKMQKLFYYLNYNEENGVE